MKVIPIDNASLTDCIRHAQRERVVITRKGKAVALVVALDELEVDQVEIGTDDDFWQLIRERRRQPLISRQELEKRLAAKPRGRARKTA